MNKDNITGHARERETAEILGEAGYDIEHRPTLDKSDGIPTRRGPDYRINGKIYDNIAIKKGGDELQVSRAIRTKLRKGQARRFVLNLTDYDGPLDKLLVHIAKQKYWDLEDLIFIVTK